MYNLLSNIEYTTYIGHMVYAMEDIVTYYIDIMKPATDIAEFMLYIHGDLAVHCHFTIGTRTILRFTSADILCTKSGLLDFHVTVPILHTKLVLDKNMELLIHNKYVTAIHDIAYEPSTKTGIHLLPHYLMGRK